MRKALIMNMGSQKPLIVLQRIKFLKEAADLGHADALFFLGMNAVESGDLEQARAYADSAIALGNMAGKYISAEISEQEYLGDSEELYKAGFKALKRES